MRQSVSGLRQIGDLGPSYGVQFTFSPSIAILAGKVDKLGVDIRSFREPLHRAVKEVMVPSIKQNFAAGGRPKWPKLSAATLEIKAARGFGATPLRATGRLARVASQINIWTINTKAAYIADLPESIWYGKVHQSGVGAKTSTRRSRAATRAALRKALQTGTKVKTGANIYIPARPFIVLRPADEKKVEQVFLKWLRERVDKHWSK